MKFYKTLSWMTTTLIGLSILFFVISRQAATEEGRSDSSFSVNLGKSLPHGAKFVEVKDGTPPPLMEFIMKSDYVVIASAGAVIPVGKRGVNPLNSDASERMVRDLFPISVENVLFSKKAFEDNVLPVPVHKLEILTTTKYLDDLILLNGNRYLLFLTEIPKDDEMFNLLEIDREKTYHRRYAGTTTIFPVTGRSVHGYNKNGLIELSAGKYPEVVDNITRLCAALMTVNKESRLSNLKKLAKSGDKVLSENALYAIKYLNN